MTGRLLTQCAAQSGTCWARFIQRRRIVGFVSVGLLLFIACIGFDTIEQPETGYCNSTFQVEVSVWVDAEDGEWVPTFGILLPTGWSVTDSVPYIGDLAGTFVHSSEQSDTMQHQDPAPIGYFWWVGVSNDTLFSLPDGTVVITPEIQTDTRVGTFYLDYICGHVGALDFIRSDDHPITIIASGTVTGTADLVGTEDDSGVKVSTQGFPEWYAYTDTSGSYELHAAPGAYTMVAQKLGYQYGYATDVVVESGVVTPGVDFVLELTGPPPSNLIAESGLPQRIPLTWEAPFPAPTFYRAYRRIGPGDVYVLLADSILGAGYVDTAALPFMPHHYVVTARYSNPDGESLYSNEACANAGSDWLEPAFEYLDFGSIEQLNLLEDAVQVDSVLRLTPNAVAQLGAAWYIAQQPVDGGFWTIFQFRISDKGGISDMDGRNGGDGFAFVIQNVGNSEPPAGGGGEIGYGGPSGIINSVAVEYDTWGNTEYGDPNGNHISVQSRGTGANSSHHDYSLGCAADIADMSDEGIHTTGIMYQPGQMDIYLDDFAIPVLSVSIDIDELLTLSSGKAWVGFTSATGNAWENHDILNWLFAKPTGWMTLSGSLSGGELLLQWSPWPGAGAYWVYGAENDAHFSPGFSPGYQHRLAVVWPETSWSSPNGVGDPNCNWTYMVLAVDASEQELCRSNRFGQFDFSLW